MAEIASAPVFVDMAVTVAANGQTAHITSATLTPSTRVTRITDVSGKDHIVGSPEVAWQLALNTIQDHTTANSLQLFMLANTGTTLACTATVPGGSYAFNIIGSPLPAGGAGGSIAAGSMTYEATDVVFTADAG